MFDQVPMAPPDPILGITDAFNSDPNPHKINLSVGVYKDAEGRTPILNSVKIAAQRILEAEKTKSYLPINGSPEYGDAVQKLVLGAGHPVVAERRASTAHTPGGTGALRVAGDYLHRNHPGAAIWLSKPTWANHQGIFEAAGLKTSEYNYFDGTANALDFEGMLADVARIPANDAILLHGCCHNPTGADPTTEQWRRLGALLAERNILPLVDLAYQGLGDGLDEDTAGIRAMLESKPEMLICSSFSKNFSLYNERVGALTAVAASPDAAARVMSNIKIAVRTNYSNPPSHGGKIVTAILTDATLRAQWVAEVNAMRDRINGMRRLFVETLAAKNVPGNFDFITRQKGMFSFSGLTKDHVARMRDELAIYIVGSGRINVAGMTPSNMDRLCSAIKTVLS